MIEEIEQCVSRQDRLVCWFNNIYLSWLPWASGLQKDQLNVLTQYFSGAMPKKTDSSSIEIAFLYCLYSQHRKLFRRYLKGRPCYHFVDENNFHRNACPFVSQKAFALASDKKRDKRKTNRHLHWVHISICSHHIDLESMNSELSWNKIIELEISYELLDYKLCCE